MIFDRRDKDLTKALIFVVILKIIIEEKEEEFPTLLQSFAISISDLKPTNFHKWTYAKPSFI